jgi:predicted HTH domain antitoxin
MTTATILLPDTVSESDARLLLAVKLFEVGRLSCGKAAEIAGFSKRAFMEILGQQRVAVLNSAADEVVRDLANAQ